jgi:zinc protease
MSPYREVPIHNNMQAGPKRFLAVMCACLALGVAAYGQTTSPSTANPPAATAPTPTAAQILDRYATVIGGHGAWDKIHSRTSLGRIEIPSVNLSGTVMIHEKAPNRTLLVVILSGATFRQAYDGTIGWTDDPQNGLRDQAGPELAEAGRDADFYHPFDLKKLYSKFAVTGTENIDGKDAYILEATTADGSVDKMYFDKESGLIVRVVGQRHSNGQVTNFQEDLGDYRDVDGVKLPFELKQAASDSSFTIHIDEVHHNVDLDDSEFAKPAAQ